MNLHESETASQILLEGKNRIATPGKTDIEKEIFGNDGFNFKDLIDIVNPLQHIPVVSTLYRDLTGDEISPASRIAGGSLFFGPIGAAVSTANVIIDKTTGDDIGGHVMAVFTDNENKDTVLADVEPIGLTDDSLKFSSLSHPNSTPQTAKNQPLNNQTYRTLLVEEKPFTREGADLDENTVAALKAAGEPFDLGNFNEIHTATAQAISDTQLAFLIARGEPLVDQDDSKTDLSLPKVHNLGQVTPKEDGEDAAKISQRTQAFESISPEILEWAVREAVERTRMANIAASKLDTLAFDSNLAGAAAKEGGWFSSVMLSALKSYHSVDSLTAAHTIK